MRIAVAGGTGVAGDAIVREARSRRHDVVVLARSTGVDTAGGVGLDRALDGVQAVVDATNTASQRRSSAVAWFSRSAGHLEDAAFRAGVTHLVAVSVIGIDDVPLGYYAGKQAQEEVVRAGRVPWTIVRSTQFFSFPQPFLDRARAGVAVVPALWCQPVAVEAVARLTVDALESDARERVLHIAGPQQTDTITMARQISARTQGPRVLPLPIPGRAGRAIRAGGLLPGSDARIDEQDLADWLATAPRL